MSCQNCQNYSTKVKITTNCLVHLQMQASYTYLSVFPFPPWRCGPGGCKPPLGSHLINLQRPESPRTDWAEGSPSSPTRSLPSPEAFLIPESPPRCGLNGNNKQWTFLLHKKSHPLEVIHLVIHSFIFISPVGRRIYSNLKNCRRLPTISWIEFFIASRMNSKLLAVAFREFITFPKIYFQSLFLIFLNSYATIISSHWIFCKHNIYFNPFLISSCNSST